MKISFSKYEAHRSTMKLHNISHMTSKRTDASVATSQSMKFLPSSMFLSDELQALLLQSGRINDPRQLVAEVAENVKLQSHKMLRHSVHRSHQHCGINISTHQLPQVSCVGVHMCKMSPATFLYILPPRSQMFL